MIKFTQLCFKIIIDRDFRLCENCVLGATNTTFKTISLEGKVLPRNCAFSSGING